MKKMRRILPVISAAIAAALVSVVAVTVRANETNGIIPENVYIEDIAVGGMTAEEAEAAVEEYVAENEAVEISLEADENSVTASTSDLGIEWANTDVVDEAVNYTKRGNLLDRYKAKKDLEKEKKVFTISYKIDEDKTEAFLEKNEEELNQEAVDYGLKREGGEFQIIDGQNGVAVDKEASIEAMQEYFAGEWKGGDTNIELAAEIVEPKGTKEELEKVQDKMGGFHTDYSSSTSGRSANIEHAVNLIDGSVIYPGEEFSVFDTIGPLTGSNGYSLAGSYIDGEIVDSYGGGVCQVSTTLYNAVILAELEITERFPHSMEVSYVPDSMDAAIATGVKDMKFKNNTDAPIFIEGYCKDRNMYFNVYGEDTREEGRVVSYVSEIISQEAPTLEFKPTNEAIGIYREGQGAHIGKSARLWKVVTVDGVEVSREIFNTSRYKSAPRVVEVGIASHLPEAVAAMEAAIATKDEQAVFAAIGYWNNAAIAAREQEENNPPEGGITPPEGTTQTPDGGGTTPPAGNGTN